MNWKLILSLSSFGAAMGIATIFGLTGGLEGLIWLVVGAISAWLIAFNVTEKHFSHGFAVGLIGGGIVPIIQAFFFDAYVAHSSQAAEMAAQMEGALGGIGAQTFTLISAPFIGLFSGVVLGVFAAVAGKFIKPPKDAPPST